jgi:predicted nucleic acid-binding protein
VIVVDASVLVDALLDDGPAGSAARAALTSDAEWAAPPVLPVEVLSVTRRRVLRGQVAARRADDAVDALGGFEITWADPLALVARIWELREDVTAFDAAYVATAELLDCDLLTGDHRLVRASGPRCGIRTP